MTASLSTEAARIGFLDRAVLKKILEAAKIDEHEVDVRHVSTPYPLTAMEPIDAPAAIWIARGRIVGMYLFGLNRAQRCVFELSCKLGGWLRGRSAPRFPGFALLAELPELRTLHLHAFSLSGIRDISRLRELRQLVINGCEVRSLAGLEHLHRLRVLDISGNELAAIAEVSGLTELGVLKLQENRIARLPELGRLRRLHELELAHNPLGQIDLRALSRVGQLADTTTELDLSNTELRSVSGVSAFPLLQRLNLTGNRLERLDGVEGLLQLERLELVSNKLRRLGPLSDLPSLRLLDAGNNPITRVDARGLSSLESLDLWDNEVAGFSDVALPSTLKRLDLSRNPITSVDGLEQLFSPLKKLESIDLYETPLVKSDRTRLGALRAKHKDRIFLRIE